ncbi:hypothetical protein MRB53_041616 [Persea americana]|nr:hypothetical protein MRB53_041616 [Persea americana]
MPPPAQTPPKRACDACHRRKVRCIGNGAYLPCKNCAQAGLRCTYDAIPQKKGPKGSRAKVITELRETQRKTVPMPQHAPGFGEVGGHETSPHYTPRVIPTQLIDICVDFFFANMYPTQPILNRGRLQHIITTMHSSPDAFCLIASLCAYMTIQPNIHLPPELIGGKEISEVGRGILADCLAVRKTFDYVEEPTVISVITSFFLFGCHFCLEKHNSAWYHLREATTLALFLRMHQEETYASGDAIGATLKRRLFWLLFVTERAYALQAQKPLTLHATISLPDLASTLEEATTLEGFGRLIQLYKPFDDEFIGLWNNSSSKCDVNLITTLQKDLSAALPQFLSNTTITQAVDLRTSQQWLRVMVWQLSISQRLLSFTAADEAMTFTYPIELSRELLANTIHFSQDAMEVHGVGLVKKYFDISCTLIDVMACVPILEQSGFELGPSDYLSHFMHLMSSLRGGKSRYLPLLIAKANDALPQGLGAHISRGLTISPDSRIEELSEDSLEEEEYRQSQVMDGGLVLQEHDPPYNGHLSSPQHDLAVIRSYDEPVPNVSTYMQIVNRAS